MSEFLPITNVSW